MQKSGNFHKRRIKNYLLQPFLQIRLGLYCILLALVFVAAILGTAYWQFNDLFTLLLEMSDVKDEVLQVFHSQVRGILLNLLFIALAYVVVTIIVSIFYTHRLVGPTIAFRRQIQLLKDKKFDSRVTLRSGDAFIEVSLALNALAEQLENENSRQDKK